MGYLGRVRINHHVKHHHGIFMEGKSASLQKKPGLSCLSFNNLSFNTDEYFIDIAAYAAFSYNLSDQSAAAASQLDLHTAHGNGVLYLYTDYRV